MGKTKLQVLRETTQTYLSLLDRDNPPSLHDIEQELLKQLENAYLTECCMKPKNQHWKIPETLTHPVVADIIKYLHDIRRISCAGSNADPKHDLLAIYQKTGPDEGIYVEATDMVYKLTKELNYAGDEKFGQDVIHALRTESPRLVRNDDPDLIAVNNGIFDYKNKKLLPFDPEIVFLAKSYVNYNPAATNVVLKNDDDGTEWDIESWVHDLTEDDEITQLLWEIMSAIVRPHVPWDKTAWLYSDTGANGKSTLCALMQNLCGEKTYASIPLTAFGEEYMLEDLVNSTAVIVDENEVNVYIDKVAKLKAVVTGDRLQINRKYKSPLSFTFKGFMVQCLNGFPRVKDKSEAFYRRNLFVPFAKCFTGGERKYIKREYVKNKDVLEYVMFRVLNSNFYELSEPASCVRLLDEYKEFNDPARQFWAEFEDVFVWDLLPSQFLYDLFISWSKRINPSGSPQGRNLFINDLINGPLKTSTSWLCNGKMQRQWTLKHMDKPEPLIAKYDLTDWKNPTYRGTDWQKICTPALQDRYPGIMRNLAAGRNTD